MEDSTKQTHLGCKFIESKVFTFDSVLIGGDMYYFYCGKRSSMKTSLDCKICSIKCEKIKNPEESILRSKDDQFYTDCLRSKE
jgi:hypothetical protein